MAATARNAPSPWYLVLGMGHTPGHAIKEKRQTAPGIEFLEETSALKPFESQMNFFSGFGMPLDGRSNYTHHTGWVGSRTASYRKKKATFRRPRSI